MFSSLDRLINLANRTGDRLIVHDSISDSNVVLMDLDQYENLALGNRDVRDMSSGQLLDQINRDIAVWRANKEMDERFDRELELEDELEEEYGMPYDDYQPGSWYRAGDVLGDRYDHLRDWEDDDDENNGEFGWYDDDEDEDDVESYGLGDWEDDGEENFSLDKNFKVDDEVAPWEKDWQEEDNEIKVEDIPFDVPFGPVENIGEDREEESLPGEEPVFLEEPVI